MTPRPAAGSDDYLAYGFCPNEAEAWTAARIPAAEAAAWDDAGFGPIVAGTWYTIGVLDPEQARAWSSYSFTPASAAPWTEIGEIGPADAAAMTSAGMSPAQCARLRAVDPRCPTPGADCATPPPSGDQPLPGL